MFKGFKKDGLYLTKDGDVVRALRESEGSGGWWCKFERVVEGHAILFGNVQLWQKDGQWAKHPGGVHDIAGETDAQALAPAAEES